MTDEHALAERQPVRLDYQRKRALLDVVERQRIVGKVLVVGGRYAVAAHEILGVHLAALQPCRRLFRSERAHAVVVQFVHEPQIQRVVGRDDNQLDAAREHRFLDFLEVGRTAADANRVLGNTRVSGQAVDLAYLFALFQFFDDCVFSSAAADYQNFHYYSPLLLVGFCCFLVEPCVVFSRVLSVLPPAAQCLKWRSPVKHIAMP